MKQSQGALLGACLALPIFAFACQAGAAQPDKGQVIYIPPGATVVVLPNPDAIAMPNAIAAPQDMPIARLIAQQNSLMRRMMANTDTMFAMPLPDPRQMIEAAMHGGAGLAPGSGVIMTSIASGHGSCSETVTYLYPGNGSKPTVKVTSSGDACGAAGAPGPLGIMQATPSVPRPAPEVVPNPKGTQVWTVGDPPHQIVSDRTRS